MSKKSRGRYFMKKTTFIKRIALVFLSIAMIVCCIPFTASAAPANAKTIFEFCIKELKLNKAGACGVLANIEAESDFNPNLYGDGGDSYGICQWNLSRFDNLISFCNKNGYNWKTLTGQLYFLKYELTNNKSDTGYILDKLKNVSNTAQGAYTAGYDWCYYFERPANKAAKSESRGYKAQNSYWPEFKNYTLPTEVKPTPAPSYKLGDVNSDGKINSNDALDILRYSTGASKFSATQLKAGDLNRDGKVNSNDALIVLSISTGKTSTANY